MQVLACSPCLSCGSPRQAVTSSPICCLERRADFTEGISKLQWKGNESLCVLTRLSLLLLTACFVSLLCTFLALPLSMAFTGKLATELLDAPGQPCPARGRWYSIFKHKTCDGTSLVVLWLGLGAFTAVALVQSLVRELRSREPWDMAKKKRHKQTKAKRALGRAGQADEFQTHVSHTELLAECFKKTEFWDLPWGIPMQYVCSEDRHLLLKICPSMIVVPLAQFGSHWARVFPRTLPSSYAPMWINMKNECQAMVIVGTLYILLLNE